MADGLRVLDRAVGAVLLQARRVVEVPRRDGLADCVVVAARWCTSSISTRSMRPSSCSRMSRARFMLRTCAHESGIQASVSSQNFALLAACSCEEARVMHQTSAMDSGCVTFAK